MSSTTLSKDISREIAAFIKEAKDQGISSVKTYKEIISVLEAELIEIKEIHDLINGFTDKTNQSNN